MGNLYLEGIEMRIDLYGPSEGKIEDVLEQLYVRYGMEDLTVEELMDALLDVATDSFVTEQPSNPAVRDRLLALLGQKLTSRG